MRHLRNVFTVGCDSFEDLYPVRGQRLQVGFASEHLFKRQVVLAVFVSLFEVLLPRGVLGQIVLRQVLGGDQPDRAGDEGRKNL